MTDRLKKFNGDFYASIPTNVILAPNIPSTKPTPLNLIGRNKISYGLAQNENFLWLTENFSNITAPPGAIRGQLWYDYSTDDGSGLGGELKIAPIDSPSPTEWLTVPVISEVNTEPSESHPGRMLIYKKTQLKIRMDSEWYTVQTESPTNKQYQQLLSIKNNTDLFDGINSTIQMSNTDWYPLARFNDGAYLTQEGALGGIDQGILRYGASYQWKAEVLARRADNPAIFKTWTLVGGFYVDTEVAQNVYSVPDPRKIVQFSDYIKTTIHSSAGTSGWDIRVIADQTAPDAGSAVSDVVNGDYYGLLFEGNANLNSSSAKLQWAISLTVSGAYMSKNSNYSSL